MTEISQLQQIPLFARLPEPELQLLSEIFQSRDYAAGVILFEEGDPGDRFALVLQGEIEIIKALGSAQERLLSVVTAGDYLGEMSLLYPQGRRSASARARSPVMLVEMTRSDFEALLRRQPELAFEFTRELSARLHSSENATIHDLQEKNRQLEQAYQELQAAQAQLVEQEKLSHELDIARQIQASFLPQELPAIPGWRIAAHWQPARAVSGDFYDFLAFPDGRFGLVIGDVSGKGVPAALVMAITRSVLHAAAERLIEPRAVLERMNTLLCQEMPPRMFVTCLYLLLDPASGRLDFANAGHNLACRCSLTEVRELRATGMPLGLLPGMSYEQQQAQLERGDTLLLYSDGLTEAHNPEKVMFGLERLHACLADLPSQDLIPYLLEKLEDFTGPTWEQEDDVTLLCLEPQPGT